MYAQNSLMLRVDFDVPQPAYLIPRGSITMHAIASSTQPTIVLKRPWRGGYAY